MTAKPPRLPALPSPPGARGSGQDSTEVYLFGGHSLKVTTLDLYQGARIAFTAPVPLNAAEAGRVFQITIRRGAPTLHYDPRTLPGAAVAPTANPAAPGEGGPIPEALRRSEYPAAPGAIQAHSIQAARCIPAAISRWQYPADSLPVERAAVIVGGSRTEPRLTARPCRRTLAPSRPFPRSANCVWSLHSPTGVRPMSCAPFPDASDPTVGEGWYSVNVPLSAAQASRRRPARSKA